MTTAYLVTTVGVLPLWLFADPRQLDCDDCPDNVLLVHANESLVRTLGTILNGIGVLLIAAVLVVLVRRWRRATPAQRRFLVPVYSAGVAVLFLLILLVALQAGGLNHDALDVIWVISMVPFALVPFLFLGTLVRARMIQSGAVGELMARLGETPRRGELRDALAEALGDPSLELVYWLPEDQRFVDAARPPGGAARARLGPRRDQGRARRRLRGGDRPGRGGAPTGRPAGSTRSARPRRSPSRTSGWTPSCARRSRSCAPRGRGCCASGSRSAAGWSATSTTARSSGSSRWR